MPLILSPMPGRVKRHDSPTPVGISVLSAAVWECGRTFTRPGALPEDWHNDARGSTGYGLSQVGLGGGGCGDCVNSVRGSWDS